jgi:soluble lytic murein transglycosylase-like protein
MKNKIKLLILLTSIIMLGLFYYKSQFIIVKPKNHLGHVEWKSNVPSVELYYAILKYSKEFDIPTDYAFGIAYVETGYQGPLDFNYDHRQISSVGALGPMQVMPSTANWINKTKVDKETVLNDIDFNVRTSMKLLRQLKDKYDSWLVVFGYYNTGYPVINDYARKVYNKQYTWKSNI